jgi:hypothetical protein
VQPWIKYTLIRVGLFAIVLAALLLLRVTPYLAAPIAAVVSLCVSYIFFGRLRNEVALAVANRRRSVANDADADVEDAASDKPAA